MKRLLLRMKPCHGSGRALLLQKKVDSRAKAALLFLLTRTDGQAGCTPEYARVPKPPPPSAVGQRWRSSNAFSFRGARRRTRNGGRRARHHAYNRLRPPFSFPSIKWRRTSATHSTVTVMSGEARPRRSKRRRAEAASMFPSGSATPDGEDGNCAPRRTPSKQKADEMK